WHSATFSNDGSMVLFSDEWGGGGAAYCRKDDPREWGADAIFKIVNGKMEFQSYYKLPAPQTQLENCVAHNGSLIPIPGRTIMVQAWYQGGVSVFEWTDPAHPHEIAFFDRGPNDSTRAMGGGFWSVYWYNGQISVPRTRVRPEQSEGSGPVHRSQILRRGRLSGRRATHSLPAGARAELGQPVRDHDHLHVLLVALEHEEARPVACDVVAGVAD